MTKKELRKLVIQKVKEGKSRQEIFDEFENANGKEMLEIANIIRSIPTLEERQKYKIAQISIISALVILIIINIMIVFSIVANNGFQYNLVHFPLFIIIISSLYIHSVSNYIAKKYISIGISMLILFVAIFLKFILNPYDFLTIAELLVIAILTGLGFYLNSKMVGDYKIIKEKYTNKQGQQRVKTKIQFVS